VEARVLVADDDPKQAHLIRSYLERDGYAVAVVHDGRLHHARAAALKAAGRLNDYRAEVAWNHPALAGQLDDLPAMALDGLFYFR